MAVPQLPEHPKIGTRNSNTNCYNPGPPSGTSRASYELRATVVTTAAGCQRPSNSFGVDELLHVGPPFTFSTALERFLHRLHELPPRLVPGVGGRRRHVRLVVVAGVLEIAEQKTIPVKDSLVANVASAAQLDDFGLHVPVVFPVRLVPFRLDPDDLPVAFHGDSSFRL